jgi:hypothetical protein
MLELFYFQWVIIMFLFALQPTDHRARTPNMHAIAAINRRVCLRRNQPPALSVCPRGQEVIMRLLLGIVLGVVLTVGGSYLYDSHNALAATTAPTMARQPLVNWDTVGHKWDRLTERARAEWSRVAG